MRRDTRSARLVGRFELALQTSPRSERGMGRMRHQRRMRRPIIRAVLAALLLMLLQGCQASLFGLLNVTSGKGRVLAQTGLTFDPAHRLALDVYAPANAYDLPVIVFFYGGSWQSGERAWYRWIGNVLAREGFVVAIPDYRKYPEVRMDGFMHDAANAVAFVHAHATAWGGNPGVMFLMGHSAGAQIGALLATDPRWLARVGLDSRALAGFVGLAGPYDFLPLTETDMIGIFGDSPAAQAQSQPINFVTQDEPPMLLLQGLADRSVAPGNARSLAQRIRERHASVELHLYPDVGHAGLLLSFSDTLRSGTALRDSIDFLRAHSARSVPH